MKAHDTGVVCIIALGMIQNVNQHQVLEESPVKAKDRVRSSPVQRARVLAEFDASGLSAPAFAKLAGIPYPTLLSWIKARRKCNLDLNPSPSSKSLQFLEAHFSNDKDTSLPLSQPLHMQLPCGVQIQIHHVSQVALAVHLIKALA